jgi:radical SAM family uncharacterized protein/radical SAM-linked protein
MSDRALMSVEKPGRYAGGEWNSIRKDPAQVRSKVVLAFPDLYEIGMSYLGQKILYEIANARPDILAERVFAPWPDYERALRDGGEPLRSLENRIPLAEFDIVAFSLLYELNDSNILTILDLGRIPIAARDRRAEHPLVLAGGPAAFNPEPLAGVFDAFFLGDGEEGFVEIIEAWASSGARGLGRAERLAGLAGIEGVYVPSLYEAFRPDRSPLLAVRPLTGSGAPAVVAKRVWSAFAESPFPQKIVVPNLQAVFDRVAVEVARGCPQKCRFCQATNLYAPYRLKDPKRVIQSVLGSLEATGYEDASLFGLSVGDYPYLEPVVETLMATLAPRRVSLSLSSLRPKRLSAELVETITKVRKTGFTLVPEAATERLRRVINKPVEDKDLWDAADHAFRRGWQLIKLYFMIGLPTETDEDVEAISILVRELSRRGKAILGGPPRIHVSLSSFIPKPHTPFQWAGMEDPELLLDKQQRVRGALRRERSIEVKTPDVRQSGLEALFSRGDRRLHDVLVSAWTAGARLDGWSEHFRPDVWERAFVASGVDPREYRGRLDEDVRLPWDHIATGMSAEFLRTEWRKAMAAEPTPACTERACGTCRGCAYGKTGSQKYELGLESRPAAEAVAADPAAPFRYGLVYEKTGRFRFLGHNDLVNALQRVFRRVGVEILYSEGFHPKPVMSFGPALPLGMEGLAEFMEFKAKRPLADDDFLSRMNAAAPPGLAVRKVEALAKGSPSWMERLREAVYSLDLSAADVGAAAAEAYRARFGIESGSTTAAVLALIDDGEIKAEFGSWLKSATADPAADRLYLRVAVTAQKIPRPQDLLRRALRMERVVFHMRRDEFAFDPAGPAAFDTNDRTPV